MARALGIDDSVTTCDCCGKAGLKSTVAIELDSGEIVHYGCVCAARNTGKSRPTINAEIKAEAARVLAVARSEYRASPEYAAYRDKLSQRPRGLIGMAAAQYLQPEAAADDAARATIASRHGLSQYAIL